MELNGFNPDEHSGDSFDPVPAGWYQAMIVDSEEKETKAGTGSYLQLTIEIVGPTHAGRKLWDRLNLNNTNRTAVDIAQRTLADICRAVGVHAPKRSEDLHDKTMCVRVKHREYQGEMREEVSGYKAAKGSAAPKSSADSGKSNTPPWQRKGG